MGRPRREAGQTSSEFMGLIVVSAMIIGLLAPAGIGTQIAGNLRVLICRIMGGGCDTGGPESHVPAECTVLSHSEEIKADVTVFSVNVGGSGKLTLTKTVDNKGVTHWFVQQEGEGHIGAEAMFGEKVGVGDLGEGVEASVKAVLSGSGGVKMEFPSEEAAREFMTAAKQEGVKDLIAGIDPFGWKKSLLDKVFGSEYNPPAPTEYFFAGGAKIEGSVSAAAGVATVGGDANIAAVLGVKVKPAQDGRGPTRTVYLQVSSDAAARLGVFEAAEGTAGRTGEVVLGIEYDENGTAIAAGVEATGTLTAQLGINALGSGGSGGKGSTTPLSSAVGEASQSAGPSVGGGIGGTLQLNVDLTKGNNRDVVADGLHSIGLPVLLNDGSADTPDPISGLRGMYGLFEGGAPGTSLGVTVFDQEQGGLSGEAKGGAGLTFGAGGGVSTQDRRVRQAAYFEPGQGFVTWQQCAQ
jgi:hypothetical protein